VQTGVNPVEASFYQEMSNRKNYDSKFFKGILGENFELFALFFITDNHKKI